MKVQIVISLIFLLNHFSGSALGQVEKSDTIRFFSTTQKEMLESCLFFLRGIASEDSSVVNRLFYLDIDSLNVEQKVAKIQQATQSKGRIPNAKFAYGFSKYYEYGGYSKTMFEIILPYSNSDDAIRFWFQMEYIDGDYYLENFNIIKPVDSDVLKQFEK